MNSTHSVSFLRVLMSSLVIGGLLGAGVLCVSYGLQAAGLLEAGVNPLQQIATWVNDNLRASVYPFAGVLLLFVVLVDRLRYLLQVQAPLEQISQVEYLADLCTSLFFGIGVIWTAIGMRSALLAGLGELDSNSAAAIGAFEILQRLVNGGILLALSTTIVGGVGGYLMRIYKSLLAGGAIRKRYMTEALASEKAVLDRLDAIQAAVMVKNEQDHFGDTAVHAGQRSQ